MSRADNSFSLKVIQDIERAAQEDHLINFEIVPCAASSNKNSWPVLRGQQTLALESWAVRHVLPFAHSQILETPVWRDPLQMISCVLTVNLLHPEMATAWSRRRNLVVQRKINIAHEWRITRMVLSRVPKSNEALAYRRWLMNYAEVQDEHESLERELELVTILADRYHSNYHAWSHRRWCLQRFAPVVNRQHPDKKSPPNSFQIGDFYDLFTSSHLATYLKEMSSNYDFIACHVSDYSGLDYRTFLLQQLSTIFKNYAKSDVTCKKDVATNNNDCYASASQLKKWLISSISDFCADAASDCDIYMINLQFKMTVTDVILGFLLGELKRLTELSDIYRGHEALWSYRRFLVLKFVKTLAECDVKMGEILRQMFVSSEMRVINLHSDAKDDDADIIQNYSVWLNRIIRAPKV